MSRRPYEDRVEPIYVTLQLEHVEGQAGRWYDTGYAKTRHGVVAVYRQPRYAMLTVIHDRRQYMRVVKRDTTHRGLSVLAGRFAREVVTGTLDAKRQRRAAERSGR